MASGERFHTPRQGDPPPLEVEEAQSRVLAAISIAAHESVDLREASGRVLSRDIRAERNVPSYRSSAMDGYAVRAADLTRASAADPVRLRLAGESLAGHAHGVVVESGTTVRIMTGGLVPDDADSVVPVEKTREVDGFVEFHEPARERQHVRPEGEDLEAGVVALQAGYALDAPSIGVLASLGVLDVPVFRRPRVAIVSTGDEVVEADRQPLPGQVVNSNVWVLEELVRQNGAETAARVPIVRDDPARGTRVLAEQIERSDLVITTGGVSVGAHDWVRAALEELGAERLFWRVSMKPGKPLIVSRIGERLIFGLPGNPVSCAVAFHLFVAPALRKMMGRREVLPPVLRCVAGGEIPAGGGRRSYLRVRVTAENGSLVARPARAQGSAVLSSLVQANGLAIVPPDSTGTTVGSIIDVVIIGSLV